jgi:nickel transport protein
MRSRRAQGIRRPPPICPRIARRVGPAVAAALAVALTVSPVRAHKLSVFAAVEGNAIRGEANFRDGAPVRHATVKVLDPDGQLLGQLQTDQEGRFRFQPQRRCDHRLLVDAGSGHAAQFTVTAAELPAQLGAVQPPAAPAPSNRPAGDGETSVASDDEPNTVSGQLAQLRAEVARLRKETAQAHDRLLLRDVLGGVGFLFGIGGTAFYFLGLRRPERAVADRQSSQSTQ